MTGTTSRIIHSGLLPLERKASTTSRRLMRAGALLAFGLALAFLLGQLGDFGAELLAELVQVELLQQLADGLRAHAHAERALPIATSALQLGAVISLSVSVSSACLRAQRCQPGSSTM